MAATSGVVRVVSFAKKEFGVTSDHEVNTLLEAPFVKEGDAADFAAQLPHVAFMVVGAHLLSRTSGNDKQSDTLTTNLSVTARALHALVRAPAPSKPQIPSGAVTSPNLNDFREHVLKLEAAGGIKWAAPGDMTALRFVADVSVMESEEEVASALKGKKGLGMLDTMQTSATFGGVMLFASWLDDVWDWIKGAAKWVADAVSRFGEESVKVAKALVEGAFSKDGGGTKFLEHVPVLGLVIAGVHWATGNRDEALRAFAVNTNVCVTMAGFALGLALGGPAGAAIGSAAGKAVGESLQMALSKLIEDKTIRAEVGDISAAKFLFDVVLVGLAGGAAGAVAGALATEMGMNFVVKFGTSQTLQTLFSRIPTFLVGHALSHPTPISGTATLSLDNDPASRGILSLDNKPSRFSSPVIKHSSSDMQPN